MPIGLEKLPHTRRVGFIAWRLAVATLDEYYDQVSRDQNFPEFIPDKPHPRFFPHPTRFKQYDSKTNKQEWIEFEYIDLPRTKSTDVTFIVQVKPSKRKLVVKFVERYGVEAHELLGCKGMAPQLLCCGLLDGESDVRDGTNSRAQGSIRAGGLYVGPIRMVVMEYIEGSTLDKTLHMPEDTRTQIEKAVNTLHDNQLVFGDLRPPNVMVSGSQAYLIDFDWAGRVNEARYPLNLSEAVAWPEEAKKLELELILVEHDLTMLKRLFRSSPQ